MKNSLFIPVLALAALTFQPVLLAQPAPASPPADVGAPPKFGDEEKTGGGAAKGPRKEWKRDPEQRLARLKEALNLTTDQEAKIRTIFKEEAEKLRAERQANKSTPPSKEERQAKMKAARESVDASIATVLTPEQKAKFDVMKEKRRNGPAKDVTEKDGPAKEMPPAAPAPPTP